MQSETPAVPLTLARRRACAPPAQPKMLRLLLDAGEDVNAQDADGWTALMYATTQAHLASVRVLLRAGAALRVPGATR